MRSKVNREKVLEMICNGKREHEELVETACKILKTDRDEVERLIGQLLRLKKIRKRTAQINGKHTLCYEFTASKARPRPRI
jgi:hypothetical protein